MELAGGSSSPRWLCCCLGPLLRLLLTHYHYPKLLRLLLTHYHYPKLLRLHFNPPSLPKTLPLSANNYSLPHISSQTQQTIILTQISSQNTRGPSAQFSFPPPSKQFAEFCQNKVISSPIFLVPVVIFDREVKISHSVQYCNQNVHQFLLDIFRLV